MISQGLFERCATDKQILTFIHISLSSDNKLCIMISFLRGEQWKYPSNVKKRIMHNLYQKTTWEYVTKKKINSYGIFVFPVIF